MKLRVLHAPSSTGGNALTLSRSLRSIGVDSLSLVVSQSYLEYESDIVLHQPNGSFFLRELKRLFAIFFLIPRFHVIHYNSGTSIATAYDLERPNSAVDLIRFVYAAYLRLLQRIELAYVFLLRKKVFVTFQGDDARQGDFCLNNFEISFVRRVEAGYYSRRSDQFKRRSIERFDRLAEKIYSVNPDLMHVLPARAEFVPYSHIVFADWPPVYSQNHDQPLRVLHAPTHRLVKGTDVIFDVCEELKAEGLQLELLMVEGLSNKEAREIYKHADILIDQLFAGWYGGLAVELMALGKPVLAYIREGDLHHIDTAMRGDLPVINVTADTLKDTLRAVIAMPRSELVELGKRSRQYVENWHDPMKIAARIKADYLASMSPLRKD